MSNTKFQIGKTYQTRKTMRNIPEPLPADYVPVTPDMMASPLPADEPATVTLSEICRRFDANRLGFSMTSAFVADALGVPLRATDKAAELYSQQDVQRIGRALIWHIASVLDMEG